MSEIEEEWFDQKCNDTDEGMTANSRGWLRPPVKPAFHGACFGADSAPILYARVPLRASAAFEKERFHYEHSSCFHGRRLPR